MVFIPKAKERKILSFDYFAVFLNGQTGGKYIYCRASQSQFSV